MPVGGKKRPERPMPEPPGQVPAQSEQGPVTEWWTTWCPIGGCSKKQRRFDWAKSHQDVRVKLDHHLLKSPYHKIEDDELRERWLDFATYCTHQDFMSEWSETVDSPDPNNSDRPPIPEKPPCVEPPMAPAAPKTPETGFAEELVVHASVGGEARLADALAKAIGKATKEAVAAAASASSSGAGGVGGVVAMQTDMASDTDKPFLKGIHAIQMTQQAVDKAQAISLSASKAFEQVGAELGSAMKLMRSSYEDHLKTK